MNIRAIKQHRYSCYLRGHLYTKKKHKNSKVEHVEVHREQRLLCTQLFSLKNDNIRMHVYILYSTCTSSRTVRAQHTICMTAEMKTLHTSQLGFEVALLAPNVDVGNADDDAAHRSGLDAALHQAEELDGARHIGSGLELHLAGEHVRDEAPDPGGRHDPVGQHRHVHPDGGGAPARHGPGRHLAVAHGGAAVVEGRGGGAVAERGRVRVPDADHEAEGEVELDGDGR